MKRIIKIVLVLLICLSTKTVYADNYKIKELIPFGVHNTFHTDNLVYKNMYFNNEGIYFESIKNITDRDLSITISVGLFDKNGINIGTINYCESNLASEEERGYFIKFEKEYFGNKNNLSKLKYIAILGDNVNCRIGGSSDFIGQRVDKLGVAHSNQFDNNTELFITIISILGGLLIILFLYKFLFTRSYRNVDGSEVRDAFKGINKELLKEREEKEKNRPAPPPKEPNKPIEILEQEEEAKKEDKSDTDLHKLYK